MKHFTVKRDETKVLSGIKSKSFEIETSFGLRGVTEIEFVFTRK